MPATSLKRFIVFSSISLFGVSANSLEVFQAGDVATAEAFNTNFNELKNASDTLDEKLIQLQNLNDALDAKLTEINVANEALTTKVELLSKIEEKSAGFIAMVSGVERYIMPKNIVGYYDVVMNDGSIIDVNPEGMAGNYRDLYYESEDCSGQPYTYSFLRIPEGGGVGTEWLNPALDSKVEFVSGEDPQGYFTDKTELVKLYYKSSNSTSNKSNSCTVSSNELLVHPVYVNNPEVTGVEFPLVITGIGQKLSITKQVGSPE